MDFVAMEIGNSIVNVEYYSKQAKKVALRWVLRKEDFINFQKKPKIITGSVGFFYLQPILTVILFERKEMEIR